MTDFVFAHDYDADYDIQVWGQDDGSGNANPYGHGNVFVPYNGGSSVFALEAAFGSNTTDSTSIIAEVHELGASIQDIVDTYQTVYDIETEDVNGNAPFFFITILLDEEVPLNAGTGYIIALQSEGFEDELWLLANTGDEDFSTTLYGPYGAGGAVNWYNGWNHTPGLRMNLNPLINGVDELSDSYEYGIYPNPASDVLNIPGGSDRSIEAISVIDMSGRTVLSIQPASISDQLRIDISDLAPGIYSVNIIGADSISSDKLIIK